MSITLYYAPGTRATRIAFLLEELGLEWKKITVDLGKREHKSASYLAIHPHGVLPALKDGEVVIWESAAIAIYLADRYPAKGLAPAFDSPLRGPYLTWMVYSVATLEPAVGAIYMARQGAATAQNEAQIAQAVSKFRESAEVLTKALAGRSTLVGQQFSAADVLIGSILGFADMLGLLADYEVLKKYTAGITAHPAYGRAMS